MVGTEVGRGGKVTFGTVTLGLVGIGMLGSGGIVVWGREGWVVGIGNVGCGRVGTTPDGRGGRVVAAFGRVGMDGIGGNNVGFGNVGRVGIAVCKRLRAPRETSMLENKTAIEMSRIFEEAI